MFWLFYLNKSLFETLFHILDSPREYSYFQKGVYFYILYNIFCELYIVQVRQKDIIELLEPVTSLIASY